MVWSHLPFVCEISIGFHMICSSCWSCVDQQKAPWCESDFCVNNACITRVLTVNLVCAWNFRDILLIRTHLNTQNITLTTQRPFQSKPQSEHTASVHILETNVSLTHVSVLLLFLTLSFVCRGTAVAMSQWPLTFPGSSFALRKAFILILPPLLHRHVILKSIKSDILLGWSHFLIGPIHLSLCSHSTSLSLSRMTSIGFLSSGHTECVRNVCELQTASCWIHSPFCAFLSHCQLYPANYPPSHKLVSEREREEREWRGRQTERESFRLTARSAWLS